MRGDRALGNDARDDVCVIPRGRHLVAHFDRLEGQTECVGDHIERMGEPIEPLRHVRPIEHFRVLAVSHALEDHAGRIATFQIGEFVDRYAVQPTLHRGQNERYRLGNEAGTAAGGVDGGAALPAGLLDSLPHA